MTNDRNSRIAEERHRGATLRSLADKYGVTHERVRQIVAKEHRIAAARTEREQRIEQANGDASHIRIMDLWDDFSDWKRKQLCDALYDNRDATLADLATLSDYEIVRLRGFGRKTLGQIDSILLRHGLKRPPGRSSAT